MLQGLIKMTDVTEIKKKMTGMDARVTGKTKVPKVTRVAKIAGVTGVAGMTIG